MDVPRMYTMLCISKLTDGGIYTVVNIVNSREEVASLLRYYIGPPLQEVAATQSNRLWRKEYTILNFHLWSTNSVSSSGGAPDIPVVYKSPRRLLLLQAICKCIVFSANVQGKVFSTFPIQHFVACSTTKSWWGLGYVVCISDGNIIMQVSHCRRLYVSLT